MSEKERNEWLEFLRQNGHWAWGGRETGPRTREDIERELAQIAELRLAFYSQQKAA